MTKILKQQNKLLLLFILLLAFFLRTYNLNWDDGHHLHPDERFLTMVSNTIKLPSSLPEYFNTDSSPLNPYNYPNYQFFVYGTFPIFLTKTLAVIFNMDTYQTFTLLGRFLSAFADTVTVFLIYLLAKDLWPRKKKAILIAPLFYALSVLPIQLSHFFTVDVFLNLFLLLTFFFLQKRLKFFRKKQFLYLTLASFSYGLALSSKITATYFLPIIILAIFRIKLPLRQNFNLKKIRSAFLFFLLFLFLSGVIFRIFQPYAFLGLLKPNPQFIENLKTLQSYSDPNSWFPPDVQWQTKTPLLFPLRNLFLWGLGLPLSFLFLSSLFLTIKTGFLSFFIKRKLPLLVYTRTLVISWILFLFFYQGLQHVTTMRYFLPLYPFIALLTPLFFFHLSPLFSEKKILLISFLFLLFLYPFSFIKIYSRPHSRLQASLWIYENIPPSALIANEHWDDPLPLPLPSFSNQYRGPMLELFGPDTPQKWQKLEPLIKSRQYLFLSSNRLWGSIPQLPQKYPQTSSYYQNLFDEKFGFKKIKEFNSYPGFHLPFIESCYYFGPGNYPYQKKKNTWFSKETNCEYPGIYLCDDTSEEAFSVYDHPQVIIFQRTTTNHLSP